MVLDVLQMFHCHLQNVCLLQFGLLWRNKDPHRSLASACRGGQNMPCYSHPVWRLRSPFPSADPNCCWSSPVFSSQWGASSAGNQTKRCETHTLPALPSIWTYSEIPADNTFLSSLAVGWDAEAVMSAASLGPSARRDPLIYRAAISMWKLELFAGRIFPHTGSHQSGLTGHWLHSVDPGTPRALTGDRCPAWNRALLALPPSRQIRKGGRKKCLLVPPFFF